MGTAAALEKLFQIPQAIAGESTYGGVLETMASELQYVLPFDHIDIVVLVAQGRDHICFETPVQTVWSTLAEAPQPTGRSPVRSVLSGTVPYILTEDAFTDERFHFDGALDQPIFQATLRSRVIVPLRVRNTVFGSINISRRSTSAYGAFDLILGQRCAKLVAPYIFALLAGRSDGYNEGAREVASLRLSVRRFLGYLEQERRRLGMDLHDQTIADLSHMACKLATAEERAGDLRPVLSELRSEVTHCLTELRRIVEDALPAVLDLFGLSDAIEEIMRRSTSGMATPMRTLLEDTSNGAADQLSEIDRALVYRIAQEAINNAARHSGGSELVVRLDRCGDEFVMAVEDNGSGRVDLRSTRGISHMRSRAALIRADISFSSGAAGRGTQVQVRLPLDGSRPALPH